MPIRKRTFRERKDERRKIELKIEARDFGPISGGEIKLKPLTIFIGPNNSGKSYAAMLIHSLFESYTHRGISVIPLKYFFAEDAGLDIRTFSKKFPELKRGIEDLKEGEELEIPKQFIERITNKILEKIYEKRLSNEISRSYACPLNELIRIGKSTFTIKINGTHLTCQKDKLKIREYPKLNIKIRVKATTTGIGRSFKVYDRKKEVLIHVSAARRKREEEFMLIRVIDSILDVCISKIFGGMAIPCYYLPAARSGILQGHKALVASFLRKAPYVGIERLEIPRISGVAADFISSVISLPEKEGPFYHLAQDFENELIKGEIVIRTLDKYLSPEIKYKFQDFEISLHRASSTVSELAPLFLYLKYSIKPESILIIEEPEAHLHPENQRILAKFLVKLIRRGVSIIITTHSDYLLEQLSSFILLSKVEPKKRVERYKYSQEDFLKSDEIATYVFNFDKKSGGHKITEVEITEEDGISQEEFLKIHEALYEETIKLRRDLSTET